jgi:DNA-binding transcriptional regulator YiaG
MKHPDTATLTRSSLAATGLTQPAYAALIHVGLRTLRYWLSGDKPAPPIARLVMREVEKGWRPGQ